MSFPTLRLISGLVIPGLTAGLWLTGNAFGAAGDGHLARFKADPVSKATIPATGFWRVTRHPNYWGDAALLEKPLKATKPGCAEYIASTPAFMPGNLPLRKG